MFGRRSHQQSTARDVAAIREEIRKRGLDAERARVLVDALEREGRVLEALEAAVDANRRCHDPGLERGIVRLRLAAFAQLDRSLPPPPWPPVTPEDAPGASDGPPVVGASDLTVGVLRNGILRHGSVWVRGLVPRTRVARLRDAMDRAFEAYDAAGAGRPTTDMPTWYDRRGETKDTDVTRHLRRDAGAVLAIDSPRTFFELTETVRETRLDDLITGYLGERPVLAAEKVTMFRLHAEDRRLQGASWHQDGAFLGEGIRTVNVWFSLSHSGRDAPGLALMPVRMDRLLPVGEAGSHYPWALSPDTVAREMAGVPVWRPECDEGDVLIFDHMALHRTAADEGMPDWRYAFETWFFAPSVYPTGLSTPVVV